MRDYNLMVDTTIFNQDLAMRQQIFNEQSTALNNAMNKINTLGFVSDQATAELLGVPIGTPSSAAKEAALNRQMQLRIASMSVASQERAEKSNIINQLISLWQASGEAPPGLEAFNIQPGQSLRATPVDDLQNILALGEIANQNKEKAMKEALPDIQSQFGTDKNTASAIYSVWENPTKDAAMSDYKLALKDMKKEKIDTKLVLQAINFKFDFSIGGGVGKSFDSYKEQMKTQHNTNYGKPTIPESLRSAYEAFSKNIPKY